MGPSSGGGSQRGPSPMPVPPLAPLSAPLSARSRSSAPGSARPSALPFLPGHSVSTVKQHHRKSQSLSFGPGGATDRIKPLDSLQVTEHLVPKLDLDVLQTLADPFHRFNRSGRAVMHEEREELRESARNTYRPAVQPSWLKHDQQVLTFNVFFKETVTECPRENYRVRKCLLHYYLEDGTMTVLEPREENSGMPQGVFVKRSRVPRPKGSGGGFYGHEDLRCGCNIEIYSRVFRIVDCDEFTRTFYREVSGHEQAREGVPLDSFRAAQLDVGSELSAQRRRELAESREIFDRILGGPRRNKQKAQFLENDRKVLNFKCYWDDTTRHGSRHYYVAHYFLADDTMEMHEDLSRNSGRDHFPVFWRRSQVVKNPHVNVAPGMLEPEPVICKPEDFTVGGDFEVYGRRIHIYECDEFTRNFYRHYMGIEQGHEVVPQPKLVHVKLRPPPYTGWGTEEDSLANVYRLEPRAPQIDRHKFLTEIDRVLRFEAVVAQGSEEDAKRRFVIATHPVDDTVSVFEAHQRNSGCVEGRIVKRSRQKNAATGKNFKCADFFVGATLEIAAAHYRLVRADEAAMQYMEQRPQSFPLADTSRLFLELRPLVDHLQDKGILSLEDFGHLVSEQLGLELTGHELVTLSRACGRSEESIDCERLLQSITAT